MSDSGVIWLKIILSSQAYALTRDDLATAVQLNGTFRAN